MSTFIILIHVGKQVMDSYSPFSDNLIVDDSHPKSRFQRRIKSHSKFAIPLSLFLSQFFSLCNIFLSEMSFFLGLVMGITVGIGLIVMFVRSENSRSKRRSDLATTIAAFARMTVEDSRKILPSQLYPSWVVFSQRQEATSLSLFLSFSLSYTFLSLPAMYFSS